MSHKTLITLNQLGLAVDESKANEEGWLTIKAPHRKDTHPSFAVNIVHGGFKDNATGEAGDLCSLVQIVHPSMSYPEAKAFVNGKNPKRSVKIVRPKYYTGLSGPFWTASHKDWLAEAQGNISSSSDLLNEINSYDLLNTGTLTDFGCGMVEYSFGSETQEALVIPYPSGAQIYARGTDGKMIRMRKGSIPKESFFGADKLSGKRNLLITKSPREAMLASQELSERFDVLGINSGETDQLSESQIALLNDNARYWETVYVAFDRDTVHAEETAFGFARKVCDAIGSRKRDIRLIDFEALGSKSGKDLTDLIKLKGTEWVESLLDDTDHTYSQYVWNTVSENSRFWTVDERGKLQIDEVLFAQIMQKNGFKKAYLGNADKPTLLQDEDNILDTVSTHRMADFVVEQILNKCSRIIGYCPTDEGPKPITARQLRSLFFKYREKVLNTNITAIFKNEDPDVMVDSPNDAFLYYQNGVVQVSKGELRLIEYSSMQGKVWKSQIMQREFDTSVPSGKGEFEQFVEHVAAGDPDRIRSFRSVLGYLAHTYKNKSASPAIVLVDEFSSANLAQGGTGKSLYAQSLKHLRCQRYISGKNIDTSSRFVFMDVEQADQSIFFDDVKSDFDFEALFNIITDDMQVESKYQNRFTIPFAESPKIVLATNSYIKGKGSSFRRRQFTLPFSNHYSDTFKPSDEFGHNLFEDWDEQEWRRYDHFMIQCIQLYLEEGLIPFTSIHYKLRELQKATSPDFADWAMKYLEPGVEYTAHVIFNGRDKSVDVHSPPAVEPVSRSGETFPSFADVSSALFDSEYRTFIEWIRNFAAHKKWQLHERKSNGYPVIRFDK